MQQIPIWVASALQHTKNPEKLLTAFQKYLKAHFDDQHAPCDLIELDAQSSIRKYATNKDVTGTLCLIPSLINGPQIFDITPEYSFIRFMQRNGIIIYLLDWGDLSGCPQLTLESLIATKIGTFWEQVAALRPDKPPHMLGYCLGGTLLAQFLGTANLSSLPASATFLTTPFDFHCREASWAAAIQDPQKINAEIFKQGGLTRDMLQSYFLHLNPEYTEEKFLSFLEMAEKSPEERRFIAVEHWLNNGNDMPLNLAKDIIEDYFVKNKMPQILECLPDVKICQILSENDQIVSRDSSRVIKSIRADVHSIISGCGHVGMMTSKSAKKSVWRPYLEYINTIATQQR